MNNEKWDSIWELLDNINTITGVNARVKNLNPEPVVFEDCAHYNKHYCWCNVYGDIDKSCDCSCSYFEEI